MIALWEMVAELDRRAEVARRESDWLTSGRLMEARRVLFHVAVTAPDPAGPDLSDRATLYTSVHLQEQGRTS